MTTAAAIDNPSLLRLAELIELQSASTLLADEDPARVMLFGGGFSRVSLINLCASELRLCEESI